MIKKNTLMIGYHGSLYTTNFAILTCDIINTEGPKILFGYLTIATWAHHNVLREFNKLK